MKITTSAFRDLIKALARNREFQYNPEDAQKKGPAGGISGRRWKVMAAGLKIILEASAPPFLLPPLPHCSHGGLLSFPSPLLSFLPQRFLSFNPSLMLGYSC